MAYLPARSKYLGALMVCAWGCATPPPAPATAAPNSGDPLVVAQAWASQCTGPLTGGPGCGMAHADAALIALVSSWTDAQTLRVYRDAGEFRAIVADGTSDTLRQAVVLTLAPTQTAWSVESVEAGQSDNLWPSP